MADLTVDGNAGADWAARGDGGEIAPGTPMRQTLPIPDPQHVGVTTYDSANASPAVSPTASPLRHLDRPGASG